MTGIEGMLRSAMSDRASAAPVPHDLADAARARVRGQRRRRAQVVGGVAAASVVVAGLPFALARDARSPARPATSASPTAVSHDLVPDGYRGRFRVIAEVLENAEHGPQMCLPWRPIPAMAGGSRQCNGPDVIGWSWGGLPQVSENGETWGRYMLVGTFDGVRFTMSEPPAAAGEGADQGPLIDELASGCPEPLGGWRAVDPEKATVSGYRAAIEAAIQSPNFSGAWVVGYPPVPGDGVEMHRVLNLLYTGDLRAHEAEIRQHWGGPICLSQARYSFTQLTAAAGDIRRAWPGAVACRIDETRNVVSCTLDVAYESEQREFDDRYGAGMVELDSWFRPID
jgi:hypothetical protein